MADTNASIDRWRDAIVTAYASSAHDPYPMSSLPPAPPLTRERPGDRDRRIDPMDPFDRRRARRALEDEIIPHQYTFAALYQAVNGLYATSRRDEAILNSREHAQVMWRDGSCWPLIQERKAPVLGLSHGLEPSDLKDQGQLRIAGELDELVQETPDIQGMLANLLDAEWFGACATELIPNPSVRVGRKQRWGIEDHVQIEGDKLNWTWGRQPGVYVHGSYHPEGATVLSGNEGRVLLLDTPKWRDKFVIHRFHRNDFSYLYEPEKAIGAVGGVGLRARLYWPWNLWKELQAWWWSGMEKFGANGTWLLYHNHDNPAQEDAMDRVAARLSRNVYVKLPKFPDWPKDSPQVENIPPTNVKFEEMRQAMEFLWRWMRSIVLGGNPEEDSAGPGQGKLPEANEGQKARLMRMDAKSLGETLTRQFLKSYLLRYNIWRYRKVDYPGDKLPFALRWKFQIDDDAEKNLAQLAVAEKVISIFTMQAQSGLPWPIDPEQVRDKAGFSAPRDEQQPAAPAMGANGASPGPGQPGTGAGGAGLDGHAPGPNGSGSGRIPAMKPSNGFGSGKPAGAKTDHTGGTGIGRPHVAQRVAQAHAKPDRFARRESSPNQDDDPGVMVAWFLPPDLAEQVALADGEAPDQLHVTLAYLGRLDELGEDDDEQQHKLALAGAVVAQAADEIGQAALEGTIGGLGRFPATSYSDGREVVFVPVDVPGLAELREAVVRALEAEGLPVRHDHGFTPHVTLAYVEPGEAGPTEIVGPFEVRIVGLTLAMGEDRREVALAEPAAEEVTP